MTHFEVDGLNSFEKKLGEMISTKYPQEFQDIVIQMAYELQGKVREKTPVDTSRLRDGWQVGKIKKNGGVVTIDVFNNVEYAAPVNYGHRTGKRGFKEGVYMLELSIEELNAALPSYLQRWLSDFIRTHNL